MYSLHALQAILLGAPLNEILTREIEHDIPPLWASIRGRAAPAVCRRPLESDRVSFNAIPGAESHAGEIRNAGNHAGGEPLLFLDLKPARRANRCGSGL